MISEIERNTDPGFLGKYKNNGMPTGGSGRKPFTTRRHIDEREKVTGVAAKSKVPHEKTGRKDTCRLGVI
jgi:hypothetical protein